MIATTPPACINNNQHCLLKEHRKGTKHLQKLTIPKCNAGTLHEAYMNVFLPDTMNFVGLHHLYYLYSLVGSKV